MTLLELKRSLHEQIDDLNDTEYLEILNTMVKNRNTAFQIPEEHLASIEQGERDLNNGDFLTMEDLEKRYEKWLKD